MIKLAVQKELERAGYTIIRRDELERILKEYEELLSLKELEKSIRAYHDQLRRLMDEEEKKPFRSEG